VSRCVLRRRYPARVRAPSTQNTVRQAQTRVVAELTTANSSSDDEAVDGTAELLADVVAFFPAAAAAVAAAGP